MLVDSHPLDWLGWHLMDNQKKKKKIWGGLLAARKTTRTKELGPKKKTISSSLTSNLTGKAVGVLFQDPPVFSAAAKAAVFGGSTISVLISRGVTSPSKKMTSSSNSIASSGTSENHNRNPSKQDPLWSLIATRLPGRTDNEIKNYWNTHVKRKLLRGGIDPTTHRPINETKAPRDSPKSRETEDPLVKFLSFSRQLEKRESCGDERNNQEGMICKKERVEYSVVEERCLDLNLELRISPPWQDQQHHDETRLRFGKEKFKCTACRFGLGNGKECSCDIVKCQVEDSSSSSYSSSDISGSVVGYDFLGLNTSVLEFGSLEMN
ncbi:hypothetical protein Bca101_022261 [Brassica carinata]